MPPELAIPAAFLVALVVTWSVTPIAIRIARATGFLDRPAGYKGHRMPTPYLGGSALMVGVLAGGIAFGSGTDGFGVLIGCALVLWAVGTVDDRIGLSPQLRLVVQTAVAVALFATGHGWNILDSQVADFTLTVLWVVGVVNAINLMDNMDGAAATTVGISTAAAGTLAVLAGNDSLGALCFVVSGACLAFLHFNLARPSRVFMGDGGSMPLGLLVAWMAMQAGLGSWGNLSALVVGGLLVGVAILDTTLVVISRLRGGRPLLSGGRDHLTHRIATRLKTPDRVAGVLGLVQGGLVVVTIAATQRSPGAIAFVASTAVALGLVVVWVLEQPSWLQAGADSSDPAQPGLSSVQA